MAIAAVLAVAIHPSAVSAAESGTSRDRDGATTVPALGASSATDGDGKEARHRFDIDDGDDHFDEGDDGFDCDNVNEGEDPCEDNPEDRVDAGDDEFAGNDAGEDGCANFDDGQDRCLDDGEDRVDAGDDEYGVRPKPTDARPSATLSAAPIDPSPLGPLAAVIGLGAGGLWLLRRGKN